MRYFKYVITLVLVIALMGCELLESPVSINNDVIETILQSEESLEMIFYSIREEANKIGLELREIDIKYQGKSNIQDKAGICTIILFKDASKSSFFYEGGKVEIENIVFSTDSRELIENNAKFDHGRAAQVSEYELRIEKWIMKTDTILNSFDDENINQINEFEMPNIYLRIYNDKCFVNSANEKMVYIVEEYDMKSLLK